MLARLRRSHRALSEMSDTAKHPNVTQEQNDRFQSLSFREKFAWARQDGGGEPTSTGRCRCTHLQGEDFCAKHLAAHRIIEP